MGLARGGETELTPTKGLEKCCHSLLRMVKSVSLLLEIGTLQGAGAAESNFSTGSYLGSYKTEVLFGRRRLLQQMRLIVREWARRRIPSGW